MRSVVHLTSAHPRFDTRIFVKACLSGAKRYETTLIVADGLGDQRHEGVMILDVGKPAGRRDRILGVTRRQFARALALDADLYQLHDPELLPIGLKLAKAGKWVLFDAHEDVPLQIRNKQYLHPVLRFIASRLFAAYERYATRRLSGVIAATDVIAGKFQRMGVRAVAVKNYPKLEEFEDFSLPDAAMKERAVCYVGYITRIRGILEMVEAMEMVQGATLIIAGKFQEPSTQTAAHARDGWQKVQMLGFLDREGVKAVLARSVAGLVTLHPTPNYRDALPVKMFEYMAAGIAVIASDFPLWRQIIDEAGCGICVDPEEPAAIAEAVRTLLDDPEQARQMGVRGRQAILTHYNWDTQKTTLFSLYDTLMERP